MSRPVRFPRGRRTVFAVSSAVVLLLVGLALGYLAVLLALGRSVPQAWMSRAWIDRAWFDSVRTTLRETAWSDPASLWFGIGICVVGLIVVATALLPAPRHLFELAGPDADTAAALPASSLRRTLSSSATGVDGISAARAHIGRRSVRLELTTGLRQVKGLQSAAESAARGRLAALQPLRPLVTASRLIRRGD